MPSDLEFAHQIRAWIDRPDLQNDHETMAAVASGTMGTEVLRVFPDARSRFGPAIISAAARVVHGGACRTCLALSIARVHNLPGPTFTPAQQALLGPPCPRCLGSVRRELAAKVDAGRNRSLVAAGHPMTQLHATGTCVMCHQYRTTARLALTAGATPSAPPLNHRPMSAPTGRVVLAKERTYQNERGVPLLAREVELSRSRRARTTRRRSA